MTSLRDASCFWSPADGSLGLPARMSEWFTQLTSGSGYWLSIGRPSLLVAGLVMTLLVSVFLYRAEITLPRERRIGAAVLAVLALLCSVLAAADLSLVSPRDRMTVVVVEDRSRSIELVPGAEARVAAEVQAALGRMRPEDRLGWVRFGSTPALVTPPTRKEDSAGKLPVAEPSFGRDTTDIEAALRRALDEVAAHGGGRVVLCSDGVENSGDALSVITRARSTSVPVDTVFLEPKSVPDVRVVHVRGPSLADEDETIELATVVHSPVMDGNRQPLQVDVVVRRDGTPITTFRTELHGGEDVLRFRDRSPGVGLHRYDIEVRALDASMDGSIEDNQAATFVRVRGPSAVLVMQKEPAQATPLRTALTGEGFRVIVRDRTQLPVDLAELAAFDMIVLADVPAKDFSPGQMDALSRWVKDFGGGLLLLGSDSSMGPGGYGKTPIEEISPVGFDLDQEQRRASLSELIVIDYSGSMSAIVEGTRTKLDLANEAAARAVSLLGAEDRLGVWHVDTVVKETIPLGSVANKDELVRQIRAVGPGGGGILVDLSLRAGYRALERERSLRHLLLFADGADAEERERAPELVKRAASSGITTSVVALGEGADVAALEYMAKLGGGRFYLITDARKLPAVFAQETVLAARSSIREEPFVPRVRSFSPALRGISWESAPALRGHVVTQAKPRAQLVLDGPDGNPVLASWPVGLGQVAAWTSDFHDRWAASFIKWPAAAQLMTQLAREVARKADDARVRLTASAADGTLHLLAEATGLSGKSGVMVVRAHVDAPDGATTEVELVPTIGGRYEAELPASVPGAYVVRASSTDEHGTVPAGVAAAVLSRADELRPTGGDRQAMERLAALSGGVANGPLAEVFSRRSGLRPTATSLVPELLVASLLLMLLGVAVRRLGLPRLRWTTFVHRVGASDHDSASRRTNVAPVRRPATTISTSASSGAETRPVAPPTPMTEQTNAVGAVEPSGPRAGGLAATLRRRQRARTAETPSVDPSPSRGPVILPNHSAVAPTTRRAPVDRSGPAPTTSQALGELARRKREQRK